MAEQTSTALDMTTVETQLNNIVREHNDHIESIRKTIDECADCQLKPLVISVLETAMADVTTDIEQMILRMIVEIREANVKKYNGFVNVMTHYINHTKEKKDEDSTYSSTRVTRYDDCSYSSNHTSAQMLVDSLKKCGCKIPPPPPPPAPINTVQYVPYQYPPAIQVTQPQVVQAPQPQFVQPQPFQAPQPQGGTTEEPAPTDPLEDDTAQSLVVPKHYDD